MDNSPKLVEVSQEDREAAADLGAQLHILTHSDRAAIRAGDNDKGPLVQAFARHAQSAHSRIRREALEDAWQPIDSAPKDGTAVLVYFGQLEFVDQRGHPSPLDPLRDGVERSALGFYRDGIWHEAGTGHDMFESWRGETQLPTHWRPLPAPPLPDASNTEGGGEA